MRVYNDRVYQTTAVQHHPSGHRRHVTYLVAGWAVGTRAYRHNLIGEFTGDTQTYEVEDGHLPGYRPVVSGQDVVQAMLAHHYPCAYVVQTTTEKGA